MSVLYFFLFFGLCSAACRMLVPWLGIKPGLLQWKHWVLTIGPSGSSLCQALVFLINILGLRWISAATRGLFSTCGAGASHCSGLSCCRAQALEHASPVLVAHKLSCSTACRIFWDQGSNSCPLHCKGILNHRTTKEACARHYYVPYLWPSF